MASSHTNPKRPSAAEARRLAAKAQSQLVEPEPLSTGQMDVLDRYVPLTADKATWDAVHKVHNWVMRRSGVKGVTSFSGLCGVTANYLMWRHRTGQSIAVTDAFTHAAVDRYYLEGTGDCSEPTRQAYRTKLRSLSTNVNPGVDAPPRIHTAGHQAVKPGYSTAEMAAIKRVVARLNNKVNRRQMCAIVGLCAGAGLGPEDLRELRNRHITDHGPKGITVDVPGPRPRRTIVRRDYEHLVRAGIEGLGVSSLVIGKKVNRRNVASHIIDGAAISETIPDINPWRLRSTWLLHQMMARVPLGALMAAAGLTSARTLTDLMHHLPQGFDRTELLREAS